MTSLDVRDLEIGDRVRWVGQDGPTEGTVVEKRYGFAHIEWDDGAKKLVIGWRSKDDRAIAKNLERVVGERRDVATPGLVEVIYGEHKGVAPMQGQEGYAYRTEIPGLEVGDVVLVPHSWFTEGGEGQYATVVRLESSYRGSVRQVIRLVRKVAEVK